MHNTCVIIPNKKAARLGAAFFGEDGGLDGWASNIGHRVFA